MWCGVGCGERAVTCKRVLALRPHVGYDALWGADVAVVNGQLFSRMAPSEPDMEAAILCTAGAAATNEQVDKCMLEPTPGMGDDICLISGAVAEEETPKVKPAVPSGRGAGALSPVVHKCTALPPQGCLGAAGEVAD